MHLAASLVAATQLGTAINAPFATVNIAPLKLVILAVYKALKNLQHKALVSAQCMDLINVLYKASIQIVARCFVAMQRVSIPLLASLQHLSRRISVNKLLLVMFLF